MPNYNRYEKKQSSYVTVLLAQNLLVDVRNDLAQFNSEHSRQVA